MIKKLLSFLAIVGIIVVSNFSRIPEGEDSIIGVCSNIKLYSNDKLDIKKNRKKWVFNKGYLGKYYSSSDSASLVINFKWYKEGNYYVVKYRDLENKKIDTFLIKRTLTKKMLKRLKGNVVAVY